MTRCPIWGNVFSKTPYTVAREKKTSAIDPDRHFFLASGPNRSGAAYVRAKTKAAVLRRNTAAQIAEIGGWLRAGR
jgi:hypothetical protein